MSDDFDYCRVMNFTWGTAAIAGTATDFAGVTWSGRIRWVRLGMFYTRELHEGKTGLQYGVEGGKKHL